MPDSSTHHVVIADQAGTNRFGFMVARERGGALAYEVADAEQIQARTLTMGELTEAESPPQLRLYWTMEDWRAGAGGITQRQHPGKYYSSSLIEGTERSQLTPGRNFAESTNDSGINDPNEFINSGFAISGSDELWSFQGRDAYKWDYTDEDWGTLNTPEEIAGELYRNGVEFNGQTWVPAWNNGEDFPREYIYKTEADANWTKSTLKERVKYMITATNSNGDIALWGGFLQNDTGATIDESGEFTDSDTTLTVMTPGTLAAGDYIAIDNEVLFISSVSTNDLTVVRGVLGSTAVAHDDSSELYFHRPHHIMSATDPTNAGAWSSTTAIGSIESPITALLSMGDQIIICKTDGLWVQIGSDVRPLTPEFQSDKHPDNFRGAFNWNGHAVLPLGRGGMFEFFDQQFFDISMKRYAPKVTAWHGRVTAVAGNPESLFLMIEETATSLYHCFRGEWLAHEGSLDWRWHHIGQITYMTGSVPNHAQIFVESQVSGSNVHRRVWFGVESTGSNLLPSYYPLIGDTQDTFFTDSTAAIARFVDFDGNFPRISKNCIQLDFDTQNLGQEGRQWAIEYSLDGAAFKTDLTDSSGNADGIIDATGGQETLTFPDGTTCDVLSLHAKPTSDAATATAPMIIKVRGVFQLRPERLRLLPMTFYLAANQTLLNGAQGGKPVDELAQLKTWDDTAAPVTVTDIGGVSRDYVFLGGNMRIHPRMREAGRKREWLVSVLLAEA